MIFTSNREYVAIIGLNEIDMPADMTPGEYLESEVKKTKCLTLADWRVTDCDDTWDNYIRYVVDWAMSRGDTDDPTEQPLSFEDWQGKEKE